MGDTLFRDENLSGFFQWEREIFFTSLTGFHLNFSNLILLVTFDGDRYSSVKFYSIPQFP